MDQKLAVLFMPDDMTLTKEKTPLMLQPILFCPILTWMIDAEKAAEKVASLKDEEGSLACIVDLSQEWHRA